MTDNLMGGIIFGAMIAFAIAFVACHSPKELSVKVVDKKYCHSVCTRHEFKKFHNSGGSFSGSSSMNGLSQRQIYDRVLDYCKDFYKKERCCKPSKSDYREVKVSHFHSYDYGACI